MYSGWTHGFSIQVMACLNISHTLLTVKGLEGFACTDKYSFALQGLVFYNNLILIYKV